MADLIHKGQIVDKPWGCELYGAVRGKSSPHQKGRVSEFQYHRVRDETARLLSGVMEMDLETNGIRTRACLQPGDCLHILPGMKHRMIAVDDVVRLEDRYGRAHHQS